MEAVAYQKPLSIRQPDRESVMESWLGAHMLTRCQPDDSNVDIRYAGARIQLAPIRDAAPSREMSCFLQSHRWSDWKPKCFVWAGGRS
jgi:hypothetical protein